MLNPNNVRMQCQLITVEELRDYVYYHGILLENVRPYRWSVQSQSKYIESLLIRIPVTPVYIKQTAYEYETHMIDGLQRVRTICRYLNNRFRLRGLEYQLDTQNNETVEGKKFNELPEELQDRLKNATIAIHIVEQLTPENIVRNLEDRLNMKHLHPRNQENNHRPNNQEENHTHEEQAQETSGQYVSSF